MKRITSLLFALCLMGASAQAQSTMPAMGANTPKGEVAKTDASLNQTNANQTSNSAKTKKTSGQRVQKVKMTQNKPMGTM